jgi:hypothetical protein
MLALAALNGIIRGFLLTPIIGNLSLARLPAT